jgi:hypothetical protein
MASREDWVGRFKLPDGSSSAERRATLTIVRIVGVGAEGSGSQDRARDTSSPRVPSHSVPSCPIPSCPELSHPGAGIPSHLGDRVPSHPGACPVPARDSGCLLIMVAPKVSGPDFRRSSVGRCTVSRSPIAVPSQFALVTLMRPDRISIGGLFNHKGSKTRSLMVLP